MSFTRLIHSILSITLISITISNTQAQIPNKFEKEVQQWEKEMVLNGIVGPPCRVDNNWSLWEEDNPEVYFGLQEIASYKHDYNQDGIIDGLFFFNAINCVAGNGSDSDFGMLVYSHQGETLTNKHLTDIIEKKINSALFDLKIYDISRTYIRYKGLNNVVHGEYFTWLKNDSTCCNSYQGTFCYDPENFTIEIDNHTN